MIWPDEITVEVTQADINAGEPMACGKCPVALAVARIAGNDSCHPWVGMANVSVGHPRVRYVLPTKASVFINDFDCGVPVQPFTFTARRIVDTNADQPTKD